MKLIINSKKLVALMLLVLPASLVAQSIDELDRVQRRGNAPVSDMRSYQQDGVPELYEGELDDLGPQYLLLQKAKHKFIDFFSDFQIYKTTNATLVESGRATANVAVWSNELNFILPDRDWKGGKLETRFGVRYTAFRYGILTGSDDKIVSGVTVDSLDFDARAAYANLVFSKGDYVFSPSLTYTSLINGHGTHDNTYYEVVPAFSLTKMFPRSETWTNFLTYDFAWREATSETFGGSLSKSYNDRWDHGATLSARKILNDKMILQPTYRWQWTEYLDKSRTRKDIINSFSVNFMYFWTDQVFFRTYAAYDLRNSEDQGSDNDYKNLTTGAGASFNWRF